MSWFSKKNKERDRKAAEKNRIIIPKMRKYLLPKNLHDDALVIIADVYRQEKNASGEVVRITNTFLKTRTSNEIKIKYQSVKEVQYKNSSYYFYSKVNPDNSLYEEEIPYEKYEKERQERSDPTLQKIDKHRFVFKKQERVYYIDVFEGGLMGLNMLSILVGDDQAVKLPFSIDKEITFNDKYSNFSLASKTLSFIE